MKELKNLLQVKKLIALQLTLVMSVLVLRGITIPEEFKIIYLMIVSFYYGQSTVTGAMYTEKNINNM